MVAIAVDTVVVTTVVAVALAVVAIVVVDAVANVVILTALGTIFAFLYNLSANILGGLELTLAED